MKVELFDPVKHYAELSRWWRKQDWEPLPLSALPTIGMVTMDGDVAIASGFLYNTDSDFALIEFIVGNPELKHEVRGEGLDLVIDRLTSSAKEMGKKILISYTNHGRLIDRYKEHKFVESDLNMTGMTRIL